jgi:iron complex outermembrane receptor protein
VLDQRISIITGPGIATGALGIQPAGLAFCVGKETCKTGDNRQGANSKSYGVYAQGTYRPAAMDGKLELTAGLRYSNDKKDGLRFFSLTSGGPVNLASNFKLSRVDPAFTVKYNFSDDLNAYLRYASGYRSGGANVRSSDFRSYGEEVNRAIELGLKSRLMDGKGFLNLAIYRSRISGLQLTIQEQPTTNPSLTNTLNSGDITTIKGVEVEFGVRPLDGLSLQVNYSHLQGAGIQELDNPFTATVGDLTRFYPVNQPKNSGSFMVDYSTPSLGNGYLAFHADYSFADEHWNTPGAQLVAGFKPTYVRPASKSKQLAARVSLRDVKLGSSTVEVALWGKNLTNDANIVYGFDGAAFGGGFAAFRALPRTYGVEVKASF